MFAPSSITRPTQAAFVGLLVALSMASSARARSLVTYNWITDSSIGDVPSSATFQVDLTTAQTGTFGQLAIQNIGFEFPGIGHWEVSGYMSLESMIPEPSSAILAAVGAIGCALSARTKNRRSLG
jgi:hypothetical protein